jgi:hypothetical protein
MLSTTVETYWMVSHSLSLPADRFFISTYVILQVKIGSEPSNSDFKCINWKLTQIIPDSGCIRSHKKYGI